MTLQEIVDWYDLNVEDSISIELLEYMLNKGILDKKGDGCYLTQVNSYLLDNRKLTDSKKYRIKENKIAFISKLIDETNKKIAEEQQKETIKNEEVKEQHIIQPFKLKLQKGSNNKMKLVRL